MVVRSSRGARRALLLLVNTFLLVMALVVPAAAQSAPLAQASSVDKVDSVVRERVDAVGEATFWVRLASKADLSAASGISDWAERGQYVYDTLRQHAEDSQASVLDKLDVLGASYTTYWVSNAIRVTGDAEVVDTMAADPKVESIVAPFKFDIPEPIEGTTEDTVDAIEWGIARINAPQVWDDFGVRGEGIVVANIDTGVDFDHEALVTQYRGNNGDGTFDHNYNWHDPSEICGSPSLEPCDNDGHGTHTMGTMVGDDGGDNQIGVAPQARWMAAKGCETNSCSDTALLSSAEFILAPTDLNGENARPDLRPHIVNNSWGGGGGDPWYLDMVTGWIASGIFPQFSNGNAGSACDTSGSPGDYVESYAAGAFDINDAIAFFSSRGPSAFEGEIKPNIAAPGVDVRSSFPGDTYGAISGTSMASPHVAGTVALMWSAAPALTGDIDATKALLDVTAHDTEDLQCGGTAADNNVWGEGILDAFLAVEQSPRGNTGTLTGTVTDATTGDPIAGALVTVTGPIDRTAITGDDGAYSLLLTVGTYEVSVNAYGYAVETATAEITDGGTTTLDFALDPLPTTVVTGTVTDGSGHGWPLYARIDIDGFPGGPVFTDPVTGAYSIELIESTPYTFNVSAVSDGYVAESRPVTVPPDSMTQDFALSVDAAACVAPGYEFLGFTGVAETFDSGTLPDGWEVIDNIGNGQVWRFDDPFATGNLTGGDGLFADMDSDFYGPSGQQDTELISPVFDMSGASDPVITFNTDYRSLADTVDVDLSIDGGATWTNVWRRTADARGPRVEVINIPDAAGEPDVQIRFHHYNAFFAWWWQVDNVLVGTTDCAPIDGGMVVGNVYDLITGEALNDATVTVDLAPENTTVSEATPDDPNLDDGFYMLFSPTSGPTDITADKSQYGPSTESVDVVQDGVVEQDFQLGSGNLQVDPDALSADVPMGGTADLTLTISNEGTAAAEFEITERNLGFDILGLAGSPTQRIGGTFSPLSVLAAPAEARAAVAAPGASPNEPPWVDIAGAPTSIMDNTADVFDGKLYSAAGLDAGLGFLNDLFVYDPATDTWDELAPMSVAREKPAAAFVDGLLHVVGGWETSGNPSPMLEIYDPASDTWTAGADVPTAYAAAATVALDGQLYVIGGCGSVTCGTTDVFVYDPAGDSWSQAAPYPEQVSWTHCGTLDGLIYCAGGVSDAAGETANGYVYDPAADAWSSIADLPQTQWGGGFVASNGVLLVSGGVTDNFATITNEGFSYDPATDTWTPIANSNNTVYRGASACGFYKVGGSIGGFTPVADSEQLPGFDVCGQPADVPWLSEDPTTGVVDVGGSVEVTVTLDASVPEVEQPGAYSAELRIQEDTPHTVPAVPVTMNVAPPDDWGKATGTVSGLLACDEPGAPLEGATVQIGDFVLETDADGLYEWWLAEGTYPITVSADGYVTQTGEIVITAGDTTTLDFALRLDAPCPTVTPESFEFEVPMGGSDSGEMTIANEGAGAYDFRISERDHGRDILAVDAPELTAPEDAEFSARVEVGPSSVRSAEAGPASDAGTDAAPASPDWQSAAPIPIGLVRYAYAQCEGASDVYYVISGVSDGLIVPNTWRYDATADAWTELAPIPIGQEGPSAACFDGRIYTMGGTGTNQHFVYDIATDAWSAAAPVPRGVAMGSAGAFDGKVFLIGGDDDFFPGSGVSDDVNVYDIATNTWSSGTPLPVATSGAGGAQVGEFVYVVGGWGVSAPISNVNATQRYDMSSDTWELGPEFASAKADFALAATSAALYAIAGDSDGAAFFDASSSVHRLDLGAWPGGTWEDLADPLPEALSANQAGFCTNAISGGETWSVGGFINFVWQNDVFYREAGETCGGAGDAPWLSADPTEGTVEPGGSAAVAVNVDASVPEVDQPGAYDADLVVSGSGAPAVTVPVTMNVTPPDDWGKVTGTVAGLLRCDEPGSPLAGATVQIGDFVTETGGDGVYEWWLAEGTYPITVTADGYVTATGEVTVTAGDTTTQDFTLRLDAPCADVSPDSLEFTVPSGGTDNAELTLSNNGAGSYTFVIDETPFALSPQDAPAVTDEAVFSAPAKVGELSVRSLEAKGNPSRSAIDAPPWFGGADLPGGLVRYAHAQCDGNTTSTYVFGGVDGTFSVTNNSWRYDADTNTWNALASIPTGSEGPTGVCTGGKIHVLGGDGTDSHFVYDIAADSWSTAAPVPRPVWGAAAGAFNGKIYLIGGDADFIFGGADNEVDIYDPATDSWSSGAPMPTATTTPGYAQAGPYVYVVGGWGDSSPATNVNVTQRYDMTTDTWETGPAFDSARADLALSATKTAIYAAGGDADAGGPFDSTDVAERLDTTGWPGGAWSGIDPLPIAETANNAGACTEAIFGGETWSIGGIDPSGFSDGRTFFRSTSGEPCASIREDVPWLSEDPTEGTVPGDGSVTVTVTVDAAGLADGEYQATLIIGTSDPGAAEMLVPVTLTVEGAVEPEVTAWLALESAGTIGGVSVTRADVVAVNTDGTVEVIFDGSDAGLAGNAAIDGFAMVDDGMLFSFANPMLVPGIAGTVDDSDLVLYADGGFSLYFDASDVELTTNAEDVDAVEVLDDGTIVLSTAGPAAVGAVRAQPQDLIAFAPDTLGDVTSGTWSLYFDGSDVALASGQENVDAAAVDGAGSIDLSTTGNLSVPGLSAADDDVAVFVPTQLGDDTTGVFSPDLLIDGSDLGIDGNDITAVEVPS